ncbi:MAG: PQQ-binding-like beta-propeller repeat protein [Halodesulfurarchaeum sp.]
MDTNRRRFLRGAGAVAALGSLGPLAGCSSSCPDSNPPAPEEPVSLLAGATTPWQSPPTGRWPVEYGTPGNTGYSRGSLPTGELTVRWRTSLSLPDTDAGGLSTSSPVAADGSVYVADAERVHALSLATGEIEWRSDRIDPTTRVATWGYEADTVAPAVGPQGRIVVGTKDGVVALDASDGKRVWAAHDVQNAASPIATDGAIYALGAGYLLSLGPDGTERWRRAVSSSSDRRPPAVSARTVIVPAEEGLRGFDARSGEEQWTSPLHATSHVVAADGTGFAGNYDGLHAFSVASGSARWTYDRGSGRAFRSPVVTPNTIYAVEQPGEAGAAVFALDRSEGTPSPRWCSYLGSGTITGATDEQVLAVTSLGTGPDSARAVVSFSRTRGAVLWALQGGSFPRNWVNSPALLDGAVIITTRGGTVVAVGGE